MTTQRLSSLNTTKSISEKTHAPPHWSHIIIRWALSRDQLCKPRHYLDSSSLVKVGHQDSITIHLERDQTCQFLLCHPPELVHLLNSSALGVIVYTATVENNQDWIGILSDLLLATIAMSALSMAHRDHSSTCQAALHNNIRPTRNSRHNEIREGKLQKDARGHLQNIAWSQRNW